MISTNEFSENFLGYNTTDCVVGNKDFLYFMLREDYTQWTDWTEGADYPAEIDLYKRVVLLGRDKAAGQSWSRTTLRDFKMIKGGLAVKPKEQLIVGSINGKIYVLGGGDNEIQDRIGDKLRGLFKFKTIDDELYFVGGARTVGRRRGKDQWDWLAYGLCDHPDEIDSAGFNDVDGFSSSDIYAVGGESDVWHYDGENWRRIDFPGNAFTDSVCCAGDGRVYISGYKGLTFVGRGDAWKKVELDRRLSLAFRDMVWYEDRVWCTNDHGVWWILEDKIVEADIPAFASICAGNLSTRGDILLVAGLHGAAVLENGEWHQIFSYGEMADLCKVEGKDKGILQARWHEFKRG